MTNDLQISIITPCLNRANFVSEAIDSVFNQDYANVEHIIVDGGSTDGTLEVLEQYSHLHVISEKDNGLYDAINNGIKLANGEINGFLNTDDYYEPNIFNLIIRAFSDHPHVSAIVGGAINFIDLPNGSREVLGEYPAIGDNELFYRSTRGDPIFNAWFFRKNLFDEVGLFNIKYKYAADRDFLIRMHCENQNFSSISNTIYHYRVHPNSLTFTNRDMGESELTSELLSLSEYYLTWLDRSEPPWKICVAWHSDLTSDQVIGAVKNKSSKRAYGYLRNGLNYDSYWPVRFLVRFINRLISSIIRRFNFRN